MRKRMSWLSYGFQSWMEVLIFLPVLLAISLPLLSLTQMWLWLLLLLLLHVMGIFLDQLPKVPRLVILMVGLVSTGLLALFILHGEGVSAFIYLLSFLWIWAVSFAFYFRGVHLWAKAWEERFPIQLFFTGWMLYFGGYFLFKHVQVLQPYLTFISFMGLGTIILSLYLINLFHLRSESYSGDEKPRLSSSLLRHNRLYLLAILCLTAFVVGYGWLKQALLWISQQVAYWVIYLVTFFDQQEPIEEPPPMEQGEMFLPGDGGSSSTSPFWKWFLISLFCILLLVATYYFGRLLVKRLGQFFRFLSSLWQKLLQRNAAQADELGYEDEKIDLISMHKLRSSLEERLKAWWSRWLESEPKWKDLSTNQERIRYLYRQLLYRSFEKGYTYKQHLTPTEMNKEIKELHGQGEQVSSSLTQLYNEVRYGEKEVQDQLVDSLPKQLRR